MSEGYYVRRNYGLEYEVGVARDTTLWSVSFDLKDKLRLENTVHVLLSWKYDVVNQGTPNTGLDVYVDGILIDSDNSGRVRVFTNALYDPFRNIWAGKTNDDFDGPTPSDEIMYGFTHWNKFTWANEVPALLGM